MTDSAWIERYRICSLTGRFYTRRMLLACTARMWQGTLVRADLATVLDDDAFLRPHAGEIPARVAEAIGFEAIRRGFLPRRVNR